MSNLDIKFKRITPFKRCVLQNFPFIEADFDALTNYGLLCKVVEYLNKVIASQNEVQGVTEEIVTAFNNLYDYVKNYFDNLDIQDEVNKKLDEMFEDGTLTEIFENINKSYCIPNVTVQNGIYAETQTKYTIINIPAGNQVKLGVANDNYASPQIGETVRDYSKRKLTTVATNGGYANVDETSPIYNKPDGIVIRNGVVISDNSQYMSEQRQRLWYIIFKNDGTLAFANAQTTAQQLIDMGAYNAVLGEVPLVENGQNFHELYPDVHSGSGWTTPYPHNVWGQKADGSYVVFSCSGKGDPTEQGISLTDIADLLIAEGVVTAVGVDPGGSVQCTYKSYELTQPTDLYFSRERQVATILYVGKDLSDLTDYQKNESQTDRILSDADFDAKYGNTFNSGFINLKTLDQTFANPGVQSYVENCRNKLNMTNDALYYQHHNEDETETTNIFWAKANGLLATILGDHAFIPNRAQQVDRNNTEAFNNISEINQTTLSYVPANTNEAANGDEPYSDSYALVITIAELNVQRFQLAIPIGNPKEYTPIVCRTYYPQENPEESSWGDWQRFDGDTSWKELTSTKGTFHYRKMNGIVFIQGVVTSGQSGVLGSLPERYRPSETVISVACGSGNTMAKCYVLSSGNLGLQAPDEVGSYTISLSYIAD